MRVDEYWQPPTKQMDYHNLPCMCCRKKNIDDDNNEFQPIQLQVAINNSDTINHSDTSILTAIVKYYNPYTPVYRQSILLSLVLGDDVSVQSVIGLLTLWQWNYHI